MKYGIGQKVKVKDFSVMSEEYGLNSYGDIEMGKYYFTREMKVFCGEKCRVLNVFADGTYELDLKGSEDWYFTSEMLEEDKPKVNREKELEAENEKLKQKIAELEKKNDKQIKTRVNK